MTLDIQRWARIAVDGRSAFGRFEGEHIREYRGEMFGAHEPTDRLHAPQAIKLLCPVQPSKVIALWNNFAALGDKLGLSVPGEPLYFLKSPNSFADPESNIAPPRVATKVIFEGELGIVIGRTACAVDEAQALAHVFGYTCANDVTAVELLNRDPSFAQWTRAKGMDGFCPMGPVVASGLDPQSLVVETLLDGQQRQRYPISDMRFPVARLVSLISADMTLLAGDVILCGTSIGAGSMKPGSVIEVRIDGIGTLRNRYG
jgi:2-keto-4-pentenoate hydratase/2-oxohepta-3-ene-1,7-dioic acid hydratase in catechol pathway